MANQDVFFQALGRKVRELRKARAMSQEDMLSFGFSTRHWQQVEAGRPITVTTLLRICEIFETTMSSLVEGLDSGIYELPTKHPIVRGRPVPSEQDFPSNAEVLAALPVSSVRISGKFNHVPSNEAERFLCDRTITPAQVRRRMLRFHELKPGDLHDYSWMNCGAEGTITSGGRVFTWKSYVGDVWIPPTRTGGNTS